MSARKDINIKAMKNGQLHLLIKNKQVAGVIRLFFIIILIRQTGRVSRTGMLQRKATEEYLAVNVLDEF